MKTIYRNYPICCEHKIALKNDVCPKCGKTPNMIEFLHIEPVRVPNTQILHMNTAEQLKEAFELPTSGAVRKFIHNEAQRL